MSLKIEKINKLIAIAESVGYLSKDEQTKVGALLIDPVDYAIVATGYNGFVRGAPDHLLPKTRPEKYEYTIHAETNLLINCANHGISTRDKLIISTHSPCKNCARLLQNAGIKRIIFKNWYLSKNELKDIDINFTYTKHDHFFVLTFLSNEEV